MELFSNKADVEHKAMANGTADDFCLYRTANVMEFEPQSDNIFALRDKPAKPKVPKQLRKVVYKISRESSAKKKKGQ